VWRLPPIFVGRTDEYTRTTAESSRVLADEQIFAPERNSFDEFMNRIIFPEMGIIYHKYCSNSPNTTDNQQLVKILSGSEKTGGMTPIIAREILEDILSKELPPFPKDFPADTPFSLTMAEAVKNKADATEPGQQVTALKVKYESAEQIADVIKNVVSWRSYLESEFEKAVKGNRTPIELSETDMDV
jgi:capsid portal protein